MIRPGEIQQKARAVGVRDQQIEKDYIISWLLFGISKHAQLSESLIFKGGTVLKKVYFDDYRFSEDLDFSLLHPQVTDQMIFDWFGEMFEMVKSEANIPLGLHAKDDFGEDGIHFFISYSGPLGGQLGNKKVKVDISRNEKLVFEPVLKPIFQGYSDLSKGRAGIDDYKLWCYSLEEVLVEKMRSVMQRMQARDFFDLWYLLETQGMEPSFLKMEFKEKCDSKGLNSSDFSRKLNERMPLYKGRWEHSLKEQIKHLPEFEMVEREVHRHFKNWML